MASKNDIQALTALVAQLAQQVSDLTDAQNGRTMAAPSPAPAKRSSKKAPAKGAKVYAWKPWACSKFGIPAKVGATFDYVGKSGTATTHRVTAISADGIVSSVRA